MSKSITQIPFNPKRWRLLPGDHVMIFDGQTGGYVWLPVSEVLIGARTRVKAAGLNFYFDHALVKGVRREAQL